MPNVEAPEPYASIIEQRMADDRAYFEAHPDAKSFVRPETSGEFWPEADTRQDVLVSLIGPGMRSRSRIDA